MGLLAKVTFWDGGTISAVVIEAAARARKIVVGSIFFFFIANGECEKRRTMVCVVWMEDIC